MDSFQNIIPPTIREIRDFSGLASTGSIQRYLDKLENEGDIIKDKGCRRSIRLKKKS
ncbi:transcriptional regulator [Clostridium chromiireducens]|uniref:Transcriptional regulator n=1 Tax=Clostridium chromiireducens TaxID=225345 RepID=A0A964RNY6_9CLOT|nr:transcriptional regulator [Clostridium chromiireducens]MVX65384.1 transcriptional regulator [Clostridium chromiireducens]